MKAGILCWLCVLITTGNAKPELQLLQIIYAHKTYAPISSLIYSNESSLPAKMSYDYFNFATLQMPNVGKLNMYNLGTHIRDVYDEFLGKLYRIETMKVRTADYPLSIMSAQLVNAGLWPPTGLNKWSDEIDWQPIPFDFAKVSEDAMFLGFRCPSFLYEVFKAYFSYDMTSKMLHHWPLFEYVSNHTGMEMHSPSQVALLYSIFETQASLNESLPHWAKDIFPDGEMSNVTLLDYYILSRTPLQKKLIGGVFIKEILGNILDYIRGIMPRERKLMLYSGNDRNIVGILNALDVWSPHIPNEGASVIFETYFDNETDIYGLKINYYTGVDDDTIPLTIPNCTEICPLEKFINIVFDMIPENTKALCYEKIESSTTSADFNHGPAMSFHKLCDVILILVCVSTFFVY